MSLCVKYKCHDDPFSHLQAAVEADEVVAMVTENKTQITVI